MGTQKAYYKVAWKRDVYRTYFLYVAKIRRKFPRRVVADSPETSVITYYWKRSDMAEHGNVHQHHRETRELRGHVSLM